VRRDLNPLSKTASLLLLAVVLLLPRVAVACSVCFGAPDEPQTRGVKYAILFLLFVIGGVLACILAFAVRVVRRSRLVPPDPMTRDQFDSAMNPAQENGLSHW